MEKSVNQTQPHQAIVLDTSNKQNKSTVETNDEALLDFSSMFKKNGFIKRPTPKLGPNRKTQTSQPNWLLQIPAKLQITLKDLQQRRYINQQKWKIITKTSQPQNASIYALISALNYLIKNNPSTLQPLTFHQIQSHLLQHNFIPEGKTRQSTILNCCQLIKKLYQIENLQTKIHEIKQEGKNQQFLSYVLENQANTKKSFIYICYGQVLCPIGFENTPLVPLDAYKTLEQIKPQNMEMWLIFGSPVKSHAPLVIKRWSDVEKEMASRWPEYLDLNETKKGRQLWDKESEQVLDVSRKQASCWIQLTLNQ